MLTFSVGNSSPAVREQGARARAQMEVVAPELGGESDVDEPTRYSAGSPQMEYSRLSPTVRDEMQVLHASGHIA